MFQRFSSVVYHGDPVNRKGTLPANKNQQAVGEGIEMAAVSVDVQNVPEYDLNGITCIFLTSCLFSFNILTLKYRSCSTVGAVYITNAKSIINDRFGVFFLCKQFFLRLFLFLHPKLRTICYKKQEKKILKNFVLEGKN
jgi:hypothetical protein